MKFVALSIAALALSVLATSSAHAAQFTFDPNTGVGAKRSDNVLPISIVAIASLIGAVLILLERRKAKGIWFSNSERMR